MPRQSIFGNRTRNTILLPSHISDALRGAARTEHMSANALHTRILQQWLAENGYLPEREEVKA